jgi:hypothetical protein
MALFVVESEYSTDGAQSEKAFEREFEHTIGELLSHNLKAQMDAVLADLVTADRAKDKAKVSELNQKFQELSTKIRGYSS